MELTQESKQHVERVARDALDQFDKVAAAAHKAIRNAPNLGTDALVVAQTFTGGAAVQRLPEGGRHHAERCTLHIRQIYDRGVT